MSERQLLQLRELRLLHAQMQFIALHQLRQLVHHALHVLHAGSAQPLVHIESLQTDIATHQHRRAHRERALRRLVVRDHHSLSTRRAPSPSLPQLRAHSRHHRAAARVQNQRRSGQVAQDLLEVLRLARLRRSYIALQLRLADHHVAADLVRGLAEVVLALAAVLHHVHRLDAASLAQLDHGQTHRRGGVVLEHHVAALQRHEVVEEAVGNTRRIQKNRAGLGRQTFRHGQNVVLGNDHLLGPGSYVISADIHYEPL